MITEDRDQIDEDRTQYTNFEYSRREQTNNKVLNRENESYSLPPTDDYVLSDKLS